MVVEDNASPSGKGASGGDGTTTSSPLDMPLPEEPPKMEEVVSPAILAAIIAGYKPGLNLVKFQTQPGSKVGDNYMSIMYALEIELKDEKSGEGETLHCMLKTIPRSAVRKGMINEMAVFKKEAALYKDVFPVFIEFQTQLQVSSTYFFSAWPICYAAHIDGDSDYLAMENLKVAGYKMGNRAVGVDYTHCCVVLRNLARFHALSYVKYGGSRDRIVEQFPILKTSSMFNADSKMGEMQLQFFKQSFKTQAQQLRERGESLAATRLDKLAEADIGAIMSNLILKANPAAVVTHGDCWVNNMLFSYDEADEECQVPTNVVFLDFQLSQASSRLIDVYYFLMTSARLDVLKEREQDLLLTYYSEFTSFAQLLGVDTKAEGLSWSKFIEEGNHYKFYGVLIGILCAPMMTADSEDIPDMEEITEEELKSEEMVQKFFKTEKEASFAKVIAICEEFLPTCPQAVDMI